MHKEFPSCQRLDIHLENERLIYFDEDDNPQEILSREIPESALTAWFNYNRHNPDDAEAKDTFYPDFCEKYTFHKSNRPRVWKKRAGGFRGTIGRIHAVSPKDIEKFHLRMLLYKIKGATCFADLKVHNGQTYPTFQATARAMDLLTNDNEWSATMTEATLSQPPRFLRRLFCILLAFCEISDPYQLWLDFTNQLSEDYLYNEQQKAAANGTAIPQAIKETMYGHCLLYLNEILLDHRYDLRNMEEFKDVFPAEHTRSDGGADGSNSLERMHSLLREEALQAADPDAFTFNESQRIVYETIRDAALDPNPDLTTSRVFFVDGPGGTGKTFLFNALLDSIRRADGIALAVASSGTASLLLKGGRTAHSTFKIPLEVSSQTMCDLTPRCAISSFIISSKIIVWDECSMISKDLIEIVDRTFRDLTKINLPFGGRLIVFGGDFRQVLPIIPKASRSHIVENCLNRANFWPHVRSLKLEVNMRVQQALASNDRNLALQLQEFADYLLRVGQGTTPTTVTLLPPLFFLYGSQSSRFYLKSFKCRNE